VEKENLAPLNKIDRGLQFMLYTNKKEDAIFNILFDKMVTLFNKEIHLRFEFQIKPKRRLTDVSSCNINT
jgi:hypothetical protein